MLWREFGNVKGSSNKYLTFSLDIDKIKLSKYRGGGIMICPNCQSTQVQTNVFQEQKGSKTITKTKSKYKEKGHGIVWWLVIGWWWWMVDLILWFCMFFPRLILRLFAAPFKKKKYKGNSTTRSTTKNKLSYKTICICQNCGYRWDV